jgi:hypothetical protein
MLPFGTANIDFNLKMSKYFSRKYITCLHTGEKSFREGIEGDDGSNFRGLRG